MFSKKLNIFYVFLTSLMKNQAIRFLSMIIRTPCSGFKSATAATKTNVALILVCQRKIHFMTNKHTI